MSLNSDFCLYSFTNKDDILTKLEIDSLFFVQKVEKLQYLKKKLEINFVRNVEKLLEIVEVATYINSA